MISRRASGSTRSNSHKSQNETHFVYGLGQLVTRMQTNKARYYYGLGLPVSSARLAVRRLPWQVAKKLLLYIFSVNINGHVIRYRWQDLKQAQNKN